MWWQDTIHARAQPKHSVASCFCSMCLCYLCVSVCVLLCILIIIPNGREHEGILAINKHLPKGNRYLMENYYTLAKHTKTFHTLYTLHAYRRLQTAHLRLLFPFVVVEPAPLSLFSPSYGARLCGKLRNINY